MSTVALEEADLSEREQRAIELIKERDGIHQSEFWKEMDVTSRTGSRIISKLREKGVVEREEIAYQGNRTYFITLREEAIDLDFSLLMAGDMLSPFIGMDDVDPQSDGFSQWLMTLTYEDY